MSHLERSRLHGVILGLLAALVVANVAFLMLLRTGGPLIGVAFYLVLLSLGLRARQRGYRPVLIGALVGLAVHVVEAGAMGWSDYPALMALNLVLPAALALTTWRAKRGARPVMATEN